MTCPISDAAEKDRPRFSLASEGPSASARSRTCGSRAHVPGLSLRVAGPGQRARSGPRPQWQRARLSRPASGDRSRLVGETLDHGALRVLLGVWARRAAGARDLSPRWPAWFPPLRDVRVGRPQPRRGRAGPRLGRQPTQPPAWTPASQVPRQQVHDHRRRGRVGRPDGGGPPGGGRRPPGARRASQRIDEPSCHLSSSGWTYRFFCALTSAAYTSTYSSPDRCMSSYMISSVIPLRIRRSSSRPS